MMRLKESRMSRTFIILGYWKEIRKSMAANKKDRQIPGTGPRFSDLGRGHLSVVLEIGSEC